MKTRASRAGGFTLVELLVVIIIVGVLAAFAVPQYQKSLENNRADDGSAMVNMVATANRMYYLDHGSSYCSGQLYSDCSSCSCGAAASGHCGAGTGCDLVACKYLAAADYDNKPYVFFAGNGASCGDGAISGMTGTACTRRKTSGANSAPAASTYAGWGYNVDGGGVITALGTGTPSATQ